MTAKARCFVASGWSKVHEHFCPRCFGRGKPHNSGWWKCRDKKCTKLPQADCKKHGRK